MLLAGLDIGTTGCKVSVYNQDGAYLGRIYRDYPAQRTQSEHEIDASAIWAAAREMLSAAARQYPDIGGIGVTSFGETFVLLDEHDAPVYPAMLYTDPRGGEQCAALTEALGTDFITRTTGITPHPMYSLPKLMWLKEHRPEHYARARRACQMQEYIVLLLTGVAQLDYSLASRTMAFDIHRRAWSQEILGAAGIDGALFSTPVPIGAAAGPLRPALSRELGFAGEVLIASISQDQVAAAIGSGVVDDTCAVDGAGTVECITPVFRQYDQQAMARGNYAIVPFLDGQFATYAFSFTGGALIRWFIDTLAGHAAVRARERQRSLYLALEEGWDGRPTGILMLPHFAGAATPYMDPGSRGAFLGLTLAHTEHHLYIAIMEGVCYEMRLNMDCLSEAGVRIPALRATGGGANSRVWMQMKADILGVPVTALESQEAGAAGSAMLVGVATGTFADLQQAAGCMVKERETFHPRAEAQQAYADAYARYRQVYAAVRPLMQG